MKQYIGKTVLYSVNLTGMDGEVLEGEVQGLSPSGKYVSIGYSWYAVDKVTVLEVLPDATGDKVAVLPLPVVQTSAPATPAAPAAPAAATGDETSPPPAAAPEATLPTAAPEAGPAAGM